MKTEDKWISDLVGTFIDPIIVSPGGWGADLPEQIKKQITIDRMLENMKALHENREPTGTDAEATAYLFTRSLEAPLDSQWVRIYMYVFTRTMENQKVKVPDDLRVDKLDNYDMGQLLHFKHWLYNKRAKAREDRERVARREEKQARKEEKQPGLFEPATYVPQQSLF